MLFIENYQSPIGQISLVADEGCLLGAWFVGQKFEKQGFDNASLSEALNPILEAAVDWLDAYFTGENPPLFPKLAPQGTAFQQKVWAILKTIPAGQTRTYGQLARQLQCRSAQAVGGAVGKNPVSIFIPCHRVLGADGALTGYAGGLERKNWLLKHEEKRRN